MASKNIVFEYVVIPILLLLASFPFVATSLNVSSSTLCIEEERVALLKIRNDLKDPGNCLSSWVGKDCCDWTGIECDHQTGHVRKLDLNRFHICTNTSTWARLSGQLDPSLTYLKYLIHLDLRAINFQGIPIPKFIGSLSMLRYLDLSEANFSGIVPHQIGNLSNLHYLDISCLNLYYLDISYPSLWVRDISWLSLLSSLKYLNMDYVNITSTSSELFQAINMIPSLLELQLSFCNLGTLPRSLPFENITSLSILDLSGNPFNSTIPSWLFNMSSLTELHLYSSSLRGPLSSMLGRGNLCKLQFLVLSSNDYLTGDMTEILEALSCSNQSLSCLDLSNNYLTGEIPIFWMGLQSLKIINLSNNSFSGGIPTSICSLASLFVLDLSNNNFSADLSLVFQNCSRLHTLLLRNNRFFGSIPKEVTKNLPSLLELQLRGNTLTGIIPEDLCRLPSLHVLDVAENRISGSIPACLGDAHGYRMPQTDHVYTMYSYSSITFKGERQYMRHIELVLKGRIMDYFNPMPVHSIIDLSKNDLTGEIPEKLTDLVHLGALNLSWNNLTGNIPSNIGSLTDLESLDLSHNHLSGPIPPSMTYLTFLSYLNLSYNNLSGQIPVANQFGTFTTDPSIYVGNPLLRGTPLPTNSSSSLPPGNEKDAGEGDDKTERLWLYASIVFGYITGFWLVCGSLVLKRSWRHAYFNFMYDMRGKLVLLIAVNLARAKCRFGVERN